MIIFQLNTNKRFPTTLVLNLQEMGYQQASSSQTNDSDEALFH